MIVEPRSPLAGSSMRWFLIDGIGPFFRDVDRRRINWSKIPFEHLESNGSVDARRFRSVAREFETLAERAASLGFNAITLDDLAHLVPWTGYDRALSAKIDDYRGEMATLFDIAAEAGLRIFVTSDLMFLNPALEDWFRGSDGRIVRWLEDGLEGLLSDFPQVAGVIFRFGETDGRDVRGDFRSQLVLRSPLQARRYLEGLLPVFERHDRLLVFRTWSVGAYRLGDLMWNRDTFDQLFAPIHSPNLCISMKYGESDFFRFLPMNRHFFRSDHAKLLELQARREYEGFGEYPSFVGWEYARYREELETARNVIGVSVWCQTGGWTKFRRRTYLADSSPWNELNTEVTIDLFRGGHSVERAVERYCARRSRESSFGALWQLLQLSDEVIRELLYVDEVAQRKIYFRRLRMPPLLNVYWDQIVVNHGARKLLRTLVRDGGAQVEKGYRALAKIDRMIDLAGHAEVPMEDLIFERATFSFLAEARRYFFEPWNPSVAERLERMKSEYEQRWWQGYSIHLSFEPLRLRRVYLRRLLALLLRDQRGYRKIDHLITLRVLALCYPLLSPVMRRWLPDFASEDAMGIDTVLR